MGIKDITRIQSKMVRKRKFNELMQAVKHILEVGFVISFLLSAVFVICVMIYLAIVL